MRGYSLALLSVLTVSAFHTDASLAQQTAHSPYAGFETRPIKALSAEQIADLRAGRGMMLALPAELNGYPGPIHVLELADQLGLSDQQRSGMQQLYAAMKAEAVPLGEQLIEQEQHLDAQFAERIVTLASLMAATRRIGEIQGALRATHLKYHLSSADALTPEQMRRYGELRGYAAGGGETGHRRSPRHEGPGTHDKRSD